MRLSVYHKKIDEIANFCKKTLLPAIEEVIEVTRQSPKQWKNWADDPPLTDGKLQVYLMLANGTPTNTLMLSACKRGVVEVELDGSRVLPESHASHNYSEKHIKKLHKACKNFNKKKFIASCEEAILSR